MIISADLHITNKTPASRKDDYQAAQDRKLRFICELAKESPPWIIAGDLFDQAKPGDWIERHVIEMFNEFNVTPILIPGQHDLPGHSLKQIPDSGLGVLKAANVIYLLTTPKILEIGTPYFMNLVEPMGIFGCPYGQKPPKNLDWSRIFGLRVLLWHHMVIQEPLWPGQVADKAGAILRQNKQFDLIITGDNHQTFVQREMVYDKDRGQQLLVNPGSMMRSDAKQINHRPCVFRYENRSLEQIFLPIETDVWDITHLEEKKAKDARISAFVEQLTIESDQSLGVKTFETNVEQFMLKNNIESEVQELVRECLS